MRVEDPVDSDRFYIDRRCDYEFFRISVFTHLVFVEAFVEQQSFRWCQLVDLVTHRWPLGPQDLLVFHRLRLLQILINELLKERIFDKIDVDVGVFVEDVLVKFAHVLKIEVRVPVGPLFKRISQEV